MLQKCNHDYFRISNLVNLVVNAKRIFSYPRKSTILLFDSAGSKFLFGLINQQETQILNIRGEEINIPIFLESFFSVEKYIEKYINAVSPKFVITFTDNNKLFYKIKNNHKSVTSIFIQNGHRSEIGDVFSELKKGCFGYQVDYMFVFNDLIAKKYNEYIKVILLI